MCFLLLLLALPLHRHCSEAWPLPIWKESAFGMHWQKPGDPAAGVTRRGAGQQRQHTASPVPPSSPHQVPPQHICSPALIHLWAKTQTWSVDEEISFFQSHSSLWMFPISKLSCSELFTVALWAAEGIKPMDKARLDGSLSNLAHWKCPCLAGSLELNGL